MNLQKWRFPSKMGCYFPNRHVKIGILGIFHKNKLPFSMKSTTNTPAIGPGYRNTKVNVPGPSQACTEVSKPLSVEVSLRASFRMVSRVTPALTEPIGTMGTMEPMDLTMVRKITMEAMG